MRYDLNPAAEIRSAASLAELATAINASHESVKGAISAGLTHARKAGQALLAAKNQIGHGHWLDWLKKNVTFSRSTVSNYIRVAERWEEIVGSNVQPVAHLNYKEALQMLSASDDDAEGDEGKPATSLAQAAPNKLEAITSALRDLVESDVATSDDEQAKLVRAERIGELILSARRLLNEEDWRLWFEANVAFTCDLGSAYVTLSLHSLRVSYDDALEMIQDEFGLYGEPMASVIGARPALPEALVLLRREGLLDDDCLPHLLAIHDDFGPEILEYFRPDSDEPAILDAEGTMWLFNAIQPLDEPTLGLYPAFALLPGSEISVSPALRAAVIAAAQQFTNELIRDRRGQVLRWEGAALWFASMAIIFRTILPESEENTVAEILRNHVARWRESLYTALAMFLKHDKPQREEAESGDMTLATWYGYHSDLRHAGILNAALEIKAGHADRYPTLEAGNKRFLEDIRERGYVSPPSSHLRRQEVEARSREESVCTGENS